MRNFLLGLLLGALVTAAPAAADRVCQLVLRDNGVVMNVSLYGVEVLVEKDDTVFLFESNEIDNTTMEKAQ